MGNTKQALKQWLARLKHVLERSSCGAYTTLMSDTWWVWISKPPEKLAY